MTHDKWNQQVHQQEKLSHLHCYRYSIITSWMPHGKVRVPFSPTSCQTYSSIFVFLREHENPGRLYCKFGQRATDHTAVQPSFNMATFIKPLCWRCVAQWIWMRGEKKMSISDKKKLIHTVSALLQGLRSNSLRCEQVVLVFSSFKVTSHLP